MISQISNLSQKRDSTLLVTLIILAWFYEQQPYVCLMGQGHEYLLSNFYLFLNIPLDHTLTLKWAMSGSFCKFSFIYTMELVGMYLGTSKVEKK